MTDVYPIIIMRSKSVMYGRSTKLLAQYLGVVDTDPNPVLPERDLNLQMLALFTTYPGGKLEEMPRMESATLALRMKALLRDVVPQYCERGGGFLAILHDRDDKLHRAHDLEITQTLPEDLDIPMQWSSVIECELIDEGAFFHAQTYSYEEYFGRVMN